MSRKIVWAVIATGILGMGMSMPSCPGQQAMQQQIDGLQAKSAEQAKRIQNLESQLKAVGTDLVQAKTLLAQVSNTVLMQKQAIEQMDAALKAATAKPAPRQAAKPAPKKRGR